MSEVPIIEQAQPAVVEAVPVVQRKSLEHLKSYSLVKTAIEWIYYVPFTEQTKEVLTPTIKIIRNTQPLKVLLDIGDLYFDSALTTFDRLSPNQVTNAGLISRPVQATFDSITKTAKSTDEMVRKRMVDPTMKAMNTVVEVVTKPIRGTSISTSVVHPCTMIHPSKADQTLATSSKVNETKVPAEKNPNSVGTMSTGQVQTAEDKKLEDKKSEEKKSIRESVGAALSSLSGK